ncbi:hypothetical protein AALM99_06000 [Lactococcus muris]|uniref:Glycosyltransferase RgtA/B/C/D-like domain-containing protein n=1 Tax=Lactococcus muris TaxID=2941330 RepID=A0ABV4D8B5_9LACT
MDFLNKSMYRILLGLFIAALALMAIQPYTDVGFLEPISVLLLAALLFFLLRFAYQKFHKMNKKELKIFIFAFFAVFLLFQIISVTQIHMMVFGDPWHIQAQATRIMQGDMVWDVWIRQYPNLLPLVALNVGFMKLAQLFHVSYYVIFYAFNIFINTSIWVLMIRFLWKKRAALAAFVALIMVILPMNYDFLLRVGYSDGFAILVLLIIALKFDKLQKTETFGVWQFISTAFLFAVGYLARPNIIIVLVALAILGLVAFSQRQKYKKLWLSITKLLLASLVGIILAMGVTRGLASVMQYDLKGPDVFPTINWIYEALNTDSMGTWTPADRDYTLNHFGFETAKDANIAGIKERLAYLGQKPWMIPVLLLGKFGQLWSCGTFATATDYQLFSGHYNWTRGPGWLIDNIGAVNIFISTYAKALMSIFLLAIVYRLWKSKEEEISVFSLSILTTMGITLFHTLLWEVKPRYQFMTIALIILAAALSFDKIFSEKALFKPEKGKKKLLKIAYPVLSLLSLGLMLTLMQVQPKQKITVNAQQHSLNHFGYSKGSIELGAGESISQPFELATFANHIDFKSYATMEMKLIIEKKEAGGWKKVAEQAILPEDAITVLRADMTAGQYRMQVQNIQKVPVTMSLMTNTENLDYPYLIELPNDKQASFGFSISQRQPKTKFPMGLIFGFAVIYLLGYFVVLAVVKDDE